jgi:hypothetical protein
MRFKNTSDKTVRLGHLGVTGIPDIAPGDTVEIPDELALPQLRGYAQRKPSVIERIAPQLVPADESEAAAWAEPPPPPEPRSRFVTADRLGGRAPAPQAVPPGVAQARAAAAAAKAPAKPDAK